MKTLLTSFAALAILTAPGFTRQAPPAPVPPKELKAIAFTKGDWTGDLKMYEPGSTKTSPMKAKIDSADAMNGMYIESRFDADMGGIPMKGLQLTTYDPAKKQYVAYWFDSMAPGVLELRGTLKGGVLVLVSKAVPMPGMPGRHAFRATNTPRGANQMLYRLEMNSGKGWSKLFDGMMIRQ